MTRPKVPTFSFVTGLTPVIAIAASFALLTHGTKSVAMSVPRNSNDGSCAPLAATLPAFAGNSGRATGVTTRPGCRPCSVPATAPCAALPRGSGAAAELRDVALVPAPRVPLEPPPCAVALPSPRAVEPELLARPLLARPSLPGWAPGV
jgi:hypothetical protein